MSHGSPELGSFAHSLTGPPGSSPVAPIDELFEATFKLDALIRARGSLLLSAVYKADFVHGKWKWHAEYQYAPPA